MKTLITISIDNSRVRGRVKQANGTDYSLRIVLPPHGKYASHILLISERYCQSDIEKEGYTKLTFYDDQKVSLSKAVTVNGEIVYHKVETTPREIAEDLHGKLVEGKKEFYSDEFIDNLKKNVSVLEFIKERSGLTFTGSGNWYRCEQHSSLTVDMKNNIFYWNSLNVSGSAIDYLIKIENNTFKEAMKILKDYYNDLPIDKRNYSYEAIKQDNIEFMLPKRHTNWFKARDYLINKRCLDEEMVNILYKKGYIYQDQKGNVVFAGKWKDNTFNLAMLRSTYSPFKGIVSGSKINTGFFLETCPNAKKLVITEAIIDAISYYTLAKEQGKEIDFNILGCTSCNVMSSVFQQNYLGRKEINENIDTVILAADNDVAGRKASQSLIEEYQPFYKNIQHWETDFPKSKDWNQDLVHYKKPNTKDEEREIENDRNI